MEIGGDSLQFAVVLLWVQGGICWGGETIRQHEWGQQVSVMGVLGGR